MTTKRSKKTTKIPRIEPTDREKVKCKTGRAKKALKTWYDRLNELARYKAVHGHTNVPQKDPHNPQLGIVSTNHPVHSVCVVCMLSHHLLTSSHFIFLIFLVG